MADPGKTSSTHLQTQPPSAPTAATPYSLVPCLTQPLGLCSNSHHTALFPASPSRWGCAPTHSNTIQPCSPVSPIPWGCAPTHSNTIQPCSPVSPIPWGCAPTHSNTIQPCSLSHPAPGAVLQLTATPYSLVPSLTQPLGLCSNSQQHHTALFSSLTQPLGLYTLLYLGWTSIRFHMSFIKYYS